MAIGFLLGIVFIMTQQMLILFAIFVERAQLPKQSKTFTGSQQAMAIFAWFLFLIYAAFGLMLAIFRDDVIKEGKVPSNIVSYTYIPHGHCSHFHAHMYYDERLYRTSSIPMFECHV